MHFALRKVQSEFVLLFSYLNTVFFYYIFYAETYLFLEVLCLSGFEQRKRSVTLYQNYASSLVRMTGLEPARRGH